MKILTILKELWLSLRVLGLFCTNQLNPVLLRPLRRYYFSGLDIFRDFTTAIGCTAILALALALDLQPSFGKIFWGLTLLFAGGICIAMGVWLLRLRPFARNYFCIVDRVTGAEDELNEIVLIEKILAVQKDLSQQVAIEMRAAVLRSEERHLNEAALLTKSANALTSSARFFFGEGKIKALDLLAEQSDLGAIPASELPSWAQTK